MNDPKYPDGYNYNALQSNLVERTPPASWYCSTCRVIVPSGHIHACPAERDEVLRQSDLSKLIVPLRDQFAMAALTGMAADFNDKEPSTVAAWCYDYADAMMAAREK